MEATFFFPPSLEKILEGIGDRRALVPKLRFRFHGGWKWYIGVWQADTGLGVKRLHPMSRISHFSSLHQGFLICGMKGFLPWWWGWASWLQLPLSIKRDWPVTATMPTLEKEGRGEEHRHSASWTAPLLSLLCLAALFGSHLQNYRYASICRISVEHQGWRVWNVAASSIFF